MDTFYLLYTHQDSDWSLQLKQGLTERIRAWMTMHAPDDSPPEIYPIEGLERLEALNLPSWLSLVLLVLPEQEFSPEVTQQIEFPLSTRW